MSGDGNGKDLAAYVAGGGSLDAALAGASPMTALAGRKRSEVERARAALDAALVSLGAEQVSREEKQRVAKLLTGVVPDLAWLAALVPAEWMAKLAALQATGYPGTALTALRAAVREAGVAPGREVREEAQRAAPGAAAPVLSLLLGTLWEGSDIPPDLYIPRPYLVSCEGTFLEQQNRDGEVETVRLSQRPILIVATGYDVEDETESVVVRWHSGGAWRSRSLSRKTVCVARLLAEESEHGLPVSSENSRGLVKYFDALLGANERSLPRKMTTRGLGWKKGHGFLWGSTLIGPDGPVKSARVELSQLDAGLAQSVAGYRAAGSWDGWCDSVRKVAHLPRVMLSLLAAMAPPLIALLPGVTNGIVDWAGETSNGKTSTLRVGASVWGLPEDKGVGLIKAWAGSLVYIERVTALCSDLPVFLDDTKRVVKTEEIGKVVYMVAQGQGRGRGTLKSVDVTATWRTFLLSTGEAPATSYSRDGGASARCLTVWGEPFDSAELAETTHRELLLHHGHLGPRLVAWLQAPGRVDELRERYRVAREVAGKLATSSVARRISGTVALLEVCAGIAADLGVPAPTQSLHAMLWGSVDGAARDADKPAEALAAAYEWAVSQQTSFYGRHVVDSWWEGQTEKKTSRVPPRGWLGKWSSGSDWDEVAFLQEPLKAFLRDHGFDASAVLRSWRSREWTRTHRHDALTATASVAGQKIQCVIVQRTALGSVEDDLGKV